MKSDGAIRQKLKQVKFRHRARVLKAKLSPHPANCAWNEAVELPDNGAPHEALHICMFKGWKTSPCDAKHGGIQRASTCSEFCPQRSKEEIKDEFNSFFATASHGQIAYLYPDVAALIWALGDDEPLEDDEDTDGVEPDEEPQRPSADTLAGLSTTPEPPDLVADQVAAAIEAALDKRLKGLPTQDDLRAVVTFVEQQGQKQPPAPKPVGLWERLFGGPRG